MRVLLAEDNPVNQKVVSMMLQRRGHEVTVVDNGKKAVETCRQETFDLVLMDIQMPEMDGFEALASIRTLERAESRRRTTPIIALTAHAMKGDQDRCLDAGFDGYLSKPVRSADLEKAMAGIASEGTGRTRVTHTGGFDRSFALEQAGGDESLLQDLIELFSGPGSRSAPERPGRDRPGRLSVDRAFGAPPEGIGQHLSESAKPSCRCMSLSV